MQHDPQKKMDIACMRASLALPFFGTFLARLNVAQDDSRSPTACTDGKRIYWNSTFIDKLTIDQCIGLLVHEICHIICKHHLRFNNRDPKKWNIACDYVINPMVKQQKLDLPDNALFNPKYIDWYAEKVYDDLPDQPDGGGGGGFGDVIEPTNEDGSAMTDSEKDVAAIEIDQTISVAVKAQKDIGSLPGSIKLMISEAGKPQIPWQDVLQKFVGGDIPDGENFNRPARHQWWYARLIMPSVQKTNLGHLVIAIDTSGSMSNDELKAGFSECKAITEDHNPEKVTVIYCDSQIQQVEVYEQGDVIERLNIKGRGGTRVRPPIDWATNAIDRVDRMIYITDMEFSDAGQEPEFPVLWLSTHHKNPDVPYGEFAHIPPGGGR